MCTPLPPPTPPFQISPKVCYRKPPLAFLLGDALPWQPQPGAKEKSERPLMRPSYLSLWPWCVSSVLEGHPVGKQPCVPSPCPTVRAAIALGKMLQFLRKHSRAPETLFGSTQMVHISFSAQLPTRNLIVSKLFNILECGFSLL